MTASIQTVQMVQMPLSELESLLIRCADKAAVSAVRMYRGKREEKPVRTEEMMKMLNVAKATTFKKRRKEWGTRGKRGEVIPVQPVGKEGNTLLWLPSSFGIEP